jgi:hypothetical protein
MRAHTHIHKRSSIQTYTRTIAHACACTHTHLVTHTQTTKPRKYTQTQTLTQTLARPRAPLCVCAHTHKRTHTRMDVQWAPLLYTLFSPYALDAFTLNSNTRTHDTKTLRKGKDTGADTRRAIRTAQSITYEAGLKNDRITVEQDRRHRQQCHSGN